jgi:ABC-type nitrate/sulfonate/bicarbonate transport system substrate-binding protein
LLEIEGEIEHENCAGTMYLKRRVDAMAARVEYGVPTDDSGLAIRFGQAKGFFADADIELAVRTIYGGPELADALDSGELNMGELGSPPALTAIAAGKRFRIVASAFERGAAFFLLVHPQIQSWSDLKGKAMGALSRGSCGYWYLRQILEQHDIDPDRDVLFRELGADYGRQLELFASGEISAMLSNEPSCGEASGVVRFWGSVRDVGNVPEIQWMVEAANNDFVRDQAGLVAAALAAIRRCSRYATNHPSEWANFWSVYLGIDREDAVRAIERERPFRHPDGELDFVGLEEAIALQHRLKAIPAKLDVSAFVDPSFQHWRQPASS